MPRSSSSSEEFNQGNNLYIANLSYSTSETELNDQCEAFGKVRHCKIIRDPVTQDSRGFGFVTFERGEDATRAIQHLNNQDVEGRRLRVERAKRGKPYSPTPGKYMGRPNLDRTRNDKLSRSPQRRYRSRSPRRRRRSLSR